MSDTVRNKNILVVDDDLSIHLLLHAAFRKRGLSVVAASRLDHAEQALKKHQFDIVIADIDLRGILASEGLELLSFVKRNWPRTCVIIITGLGGPEIQQEAIRRGANYYMEKPFDIVKIQKIVEEIGDQKDRGTRQEETVLKKILLIDDSLLIHQMYRMVLSRYKCQLVTAQNGKDGMDKLSHNADVDLMLVDINMPVMNGLEFIQKVKEAGAYDRIPIVIVSTEGREEDTRKGLALGAMAYIKKPFQPSELHSLIERLCPASA